MADRTRVAVIFGGRSGEHEVSCRSALSVLTHLDPSRYDARPVRITPAGTWVPGKAAETLEDLLALDSPEGALGSIAEAVGAFDDVDVVFPVLHGRYGEDGAIQSVLEMTGRPYVGSGVFASAAGVDREFTTKLLVADGLPVADAVALRGGETVSDVDRERLGLPVFVKPSRTGSGPGVSKVDTWGELPAALAEARESGGKVLVEEAGPGREVDVGVLEHPDGRLEVGSPLDPGLDPSIIDQLRDCAVRTFRALDCRGLLRVAFFLRYGTQPVVTDVNTFPAFTAQSPYPRMFRAGGLDYPALLDVLIETALARGVRRRALRA